MAMRHPPLSICATLLSYDYQPSLLDTSNLSAHHLILVLTDVNQFLNANT